MHRPSAAICAPTASAPCCPSDLRTRLRADGLRAPPVDLPSARREIWDFAIVKVGFAVLPSNNWASPNCHYETMPHLCNAFSIFYNSFFVLLFYLLCELTLIHLPETYPFLVTSTAVSSHSFLPSLLVPLLSSAPMAAVAVNTP